MAAVKVLQELWGPAPGKRIKAEEVNSQRWYDVQMRCEEEVWTERVVAEDQFEPLKQQSADDNKFYQGVIAHWRGLYPQPPMKGNRHPPPTIKGKRNT
jgi:hypothetical protein